MGFSGLSKSQRVSAAGPFQKVDSPRLDSRRLYMFYISQDLFIGSQTREGAHSMIPTPKPRRLFPVVLVIAALFFVVREPVHAAEFATGAFNGLMTVASQLVTFAGALG